MPPKILKVLLGIKKRRAVRHYILPPGITFFNHSNDFMNLKFCFVPLSDLLSFSLLMLASLLFYILKAYLTSLTLYLYICKYVARVTPSIWQTRLKTVITHKDLMKSKQLKQNTNMNINKYLANIFLWWINWQIALKCNFTVEIWIIRHQ